MKSILLVLAVLLTACSGQKQDITKPETVKADEKGNINDANVLVDLSTICQIEIQKSMKDPNSMKIDFAAAKAWKSEKGYKVGFKFDGKNGFGGTIDHTAVCEISKDKKLLAISIE